MAARTSFGWPLTAAFVAVAVHLGSLQNGFVLDDVRLVEHNPDIASLSGVPRLFALPYWNIEGEHHGLYRPLTMASYALNRAALGPGALGFHLVNVLLHGCVAALCWLLLRSVGTQYGTALLGSLLFATLPIHTEVVAGIAGRAELLAALCVIGSWLAHRHRRYRIAALCYLGAILSKESAILAPVLFLADDAFRGDRPAMRSGVRFAGYGLGAAVMLILRAFALGSHQVAAGAIPLDNPAAFSGLWPRVLTAGWVQLEYALLCLVPWRLVSDYSLDAIPVVHHLFDPRGLLGVGFLAGLAIALHWGSRSSRPVALGSLIWLVFALPSSNLLFAAGTIMAERLAYLPSLGLCLAAGHLGASAAVRGSMHRKVVVAVAALLIAVYAGRSAARVRDWKSNLTLAVADVATSPRSAKLQGGAGMFLAEAGENGEAEAHLRRAIAIYPEYAQMHYNLGVLLVRRGAREEAAEHLRRASELAPGNPMPQRLLDQLRR